ncbi:MAG: hypothetical protein H6586_04945 [Flavobacteriales bacterium]|nr:hypothetical protein [Flavobacteriales bacterium]
MKLLLAMYLIIYSSIGISNNRVKKYYEYIQQAEMNIVEGNLITGANYYQKAFQLEIVYLGYDIRNALRLESELIPDSSRVYWCFRNYVKTGYTGYTKPSKTFNVFFEQAYWSSIQQMLDTIKTNFNDELTAKLQNVYTLDQSTRQNVPHESGISTFSVPRDEMRRIDSTNVVTIIRLLKEYTINQTTVQSEQLFSVINLILIHNRGHGEEYQHVNELFKAVKQEVLKGNFDTRMYANAYDRRYSEVIKKEKPPRDGYYGTETCFMTDEFFLSKLPDNSKIKKNINKHRKQIYLDDYTLEAQKKLFQYKLAEDVSSSHYDFGVFYWAFPPNTKYKDDFFERVKKSNIKYEIYYKER